MRPPWQEGFFALGYCSGDFYSPMATAHAYFISLDTDYHSSIWLCHACGTHANKEL